MLTYTVTEEEKRMEMNLDKKGIKEEQIALPLTFTVSDSTMLGCVVA